MILYLTEVYGGRSLLTFKKPLRHKIDHTDIWDMFPQYGEPIDVRHLCQGGIRTAIGTKRTGLILAPLTPTRVRLVLEVIDVDRLVPLCPDASSLI